MGAVIAVLLLLFFSGCGTFFNMIFLKESGSVASWIATLICIIAVCIAICVIRMHEQWDIKSILIIMGIAGIIQLIILGTIETPYYWEGDDEGFLRLMSAFFCQPLNCLLGYGVSIIVLDWYENRLNIIAHSFEKKLREQIQALNEISNMFNNCKKEYLLSEHLVELLTKIEPDNLREAYTKSRIVMESVLVHGVDEVILKHNLNLNVEGKMISVIDKEVSVLKKEKNAKLEWITKSKLSVKDYSLVRQEYKKLD